MFLSYEEIKLIKLLGFISLVYSFQVNANVLSNDIKGFNPTSSSISFVTVQSGKTLQKKQLVGSFFVGYEKNSLPELRFTSETEVLSNDVTDKSISAYAALGYGFTNNLEVGFSFPYTISHSVDNSENTNVSSFVVDGQTEILGHIKYNFIKNKSMRHAVIFSANQSSDENNPFIGTGGSTLTWNFEYAFSQQYSKKILYAFNIGYKKRSPGTAVERSGLVPLESNLLLSSGLTYKLSHKSSLVAELLSSFSTSDDEKGKNNYSVEVLGAYKKRISRGLNWVSGFTTELATGSLSPDFRVFTGLQVDIFSLFNRKKKRAARISRTQGVTTRRKAQPEKRASYKKLIREDGDQTITTFRLESLNFKSSKAVMENRGYDSLRSIVGELREMKRFKRIIVEGHTDSSGNYNSNLKLSLERAKKVRNYLQKELSLPSKAFTIKGLGSSVPIGSNLTQSGKALNRRVEISVISRD